MNKIFKLFNIIFIFIICIFSCSNVFAREYTRNELISITDDSATVRTENFVYNGMAFTSDKKGNENRILKFSSIVNNTDAKKSVSINILLFDAAQKNIGYVTYCSEKDFGSDYSKFILGPNASTPYAITMADRYFGAQDKDYKGIVSESKNIVFYSVRDDNPYCQIGGYTRYIGLTNDEIISGKIYTGENGEKEVEEPFNAKVFFQQYFIYFISGVVAMLLVGALINTLYQKMKGKSSTLAYLPITDLYVAVSLAFGDLIGAIYFCVWVVAVMLIGVTKSLVILSCVFGIFALIVDVVKLITQKYDLMYFAPINNTTIVDNNNYDVRSDNVSNGNTFINVNDQNVTANNVTNEMQSGNGESSDFIQSFINNEINNVNINGSSSNDDDFNNDSSFDNAVDISYEIQEDVIEELDVSKKDYSSFNSENTFDNAFSSSFDNVNFNKDKKKNTYITTDINSDNNLDVDNEESGFDSNLDEFSSFNSNSKLVPTSNIAPTSNISNSESIDGNSFNNNNPFTNEISSLGSDDGLSDDNNNNIINQKEGESELSNFFR